MKLKTKNGETIYIDTVDADLATLTWYINSNGYVKRHKERVNGKNIHEYLHTVILERKLGRKLLVDEECDHRNLHSLNNRRNNLRLSTRSYNRANRVKYRGVSKYKGVSKDKRQNRWRATISVNKKQIWLGGYVEEIDAARAYDKAAIKYFGPFARINGV